ncbi:MAG: aminodeoxychorismate synthase component I, partial [Chloroflexota bacterium]
MLPLYREIEPAAPLHQLFGAFSASPYPMFLDSSLPHPRLGRYSYLVADPFLLLRSKNGRVQVTGAGLDYELQGDPFEQLSHLMARFPAENAPGLPPFQGGAVGYFAYDLAHHVERLPRTAVDDPGTPDMVVGLYSWVVAHDHAAGRTWLIASPLPEGDHRHARQRMEEVEQRLEDAARNPVPASGFRLDPPHPSSFTRESYVETIEKAKAYIAAGDIYQVCLSQRFQLPLPIPAWQLYSRLREISPVPYSAYLDLGDFAIASASPELFLRKEGRRVETRPIKGTRPRGKTPEEDRRMVSELRASQKDRAENVMIVDLLRNDLGKVCRVGSVRWPELFTVESYSTVHHLVSSVEGILEDRYDGLHLLKACFPGGSITGCPKIRAMEIIDELEPTKRGVYCGSIGFVGFNGNVDSSIVIRTVIAKGGMAYFQVGGAIVAD